MVLLHMFLCLSMPIRVLYCHKVRILSSFVLLRRLHVRKKMRQLYKSKLYI